MIRRIQDSILDNDAELDAFVTRAMFRDPAWKISNIGGTPDDPKFHRRTMEFRGPNWWGWVKIQRLGNKTRQENPGCIWYSIRLFVKRTDGPMFMAETDWNEMVVDMADEIEKGRMEDLPPEAFYPSIEAALDENCEVGHQAVESQYEVKSIGYRLTFAILSYLKGANILKESVTLPRITEATQFSDEEMEGFGQVVVDLNYASEWREADGGVNKPVRILACDINVPTPISPRTGASVLLTGHIYSYSSVDEGWVLTVALGVCREIVLHTKAEPTVEFLAKVRQAALPILKSALDHPTTHTVMAARIAKHLQRVLRGDPEVLEMAIIHSAVDEALDIDIDKLYKDAFAYEGVQEWEDKPIQGHRDLIGTTSILGFKIEYILGYVSFADFVLFGEHTQDITIEVVDSSTLNNMKRSFTSSKKARYRFEVPPDQFDEVKKVLREFVAVDLRSMVERAKNGLVPNYNSAISRKLMNTLSPWFVTMVESLESDVIDGLFSHGGAPLKWQREPISRFGVKPGYRLKFECLDGSHYGHLSLRREPILGTSSYSVTLHIWRNVSATTAEAMQGTEITTMRYVELETDADMAKFQEKTIEFAKKFLSTYSAENRMVGFEGGESVRRDFDAAVGGDQSPGAAFEESKVPVEESLAGLTFRHECRGAHSGQSDMTIYAEKAGFAIARIDYSVYNDEVAVQYIFTNPKFRRNKVATDMLRQLQKEYPESEIRLGMTVGHGGDLAASLERDYLENPAHKKLKTAYDEAKAEWDALQADFDAWTEAGKGKLPPEMLMKGDRMSDLQTLLWDLEDQLRHEEPGKWLIRDTEGDPAVQK